MIRLKPSQNEKAEQVFAKTIYRHSHMGWLDLSEIGNAGGYAWLDSRAMGKTLIALQPIAEDCFWLHSFYSLKEPGNYDLSGKLKEILPPGRNAVYAISSHNWFNELLEINSFSLCDEIIQFVTNQIRMPENSGPYIPVKPHSMAQMDIYANCESAFPRVWQLGRFEFQEAFADASYIRAVYIDEQPAGYLMAQMEPDNCHILRLAVSKDHQSKGIASVLVHDLIRECHEQGITDFSVNTSRNDNAAVSFYERLNFQLIPERFPVYCRYISGTNEKA